VLKRLLRAIDSGVLEIGCSEKGTEREIDNLLLLAPSGYEKLSTALLLGGQRYFFLLVVQ